MQNKPIHINPVALSTTQTTNLINCAISSLSGPVGYTQTQPYLLIKHLRFLNKTSSAVPVSLWQGASAGNVAGTEVIAQATPVPANGAFDYYAASPGLRLDSGDYLVGGAGSATAITMSGEAEIGIA